ncbi:ThiF family adenylyltransferase [Nocardia cyriacigeorgica]|uniref:ThiF family adenylyltransferase n=1 Tax=Nocardia cyriacigeorgica TaxID=135487 RepID=A0A5R8PCS0_9NOCA|nr:ThiF family adenylyltransferase [Nocardia cyriacigeorgica]TLG08785.1 ThiF family adenylyltransferase [Nocardia cyriacigeorgica]
MTQVIDPDRYYRELVTRNAGLVPDAQQQALARARVLVAGCGSTGGAAVEPLTRLGVRRFIVTDNGEFELSNLNRQHAAATDVGRNKAAVAAARIRSVNPYAEIDTDTNGITPDNVTDFAHRSDVVIDGVDVTEPEGWRAKLRLHQACATARKPVLSGYDMAGVQYIRFYDYRRGGMRALDGRVTEHHLDVLDVPAIMLRVVPARFAPLEMIRNLRDNIDDPDYHVPQLVYAALAFGALSARMAAEILAGHAVRRHTVVDIHDVVRTPGSKVGVRARRLALLARSVPDVVRFSAPGRHRGVGD